MPDDFDKLLDDAEQETLASMNARLSSLVRLTEKDLQILFPRMADKEKLAKLMQIVRASTAENTRRTHLINNINELAGTVIKLVDWLA